MICLNNSFYENLKSDCSWAACPQENAYITIILGYDINSGKMKSWLTKVRIWVYIACSSSSGIECIIILTRVLTRILKTGVKILSSRRKGVLQYFSFETL